jgi:hypothetical protein
MIKYRNPIAIGALVKDKSTKRLAIILDKMSTSEWERTDKDNEFNAGIVYGMQFMDGIGPFKTYRYAYEVEVLSRGKENG